jgi:hypothetical protein
MKYLTLLPFLIAAVLVMPPAHAISYVIDSEPSTYTTALVCLLLILLANGRPRGDTFRQDDSR